MHRSAQHLCHALVFATAIVGSACGKHVHTRQDLDMEISKHHINLRWNRIENAALNVHPDLRTAFIEDWVKRSQEVELQDIDVTSVVVEDDDDHAKIRANVTWIDRASFALRQTSIIEKWVRTDDGWRVLTPMVLQNPPEPGMRFDAEEPGPPHG
jgi:hypothetical protein